MKRVKQILPMLLVILIVGLVFLTLYFAIIGSPYFKVSMFAMFFVPILAYVYIFIYRLMHSGDEDFFQKDREKEEWKKR